MSWRASPPEKLVTAFDEMRRKNIFCDAVLKVENVLFPVHKLILCRDSSFFDALFIRWDHDGSTEFKVDGVKAETMSLVLDYMYTKSIDISCDNAKDLTIAADMFNMVDLVQDCFDYMHDHMEPDNCIGFWWLSGRIISPKSRAPFWRYIMSHFEEIAVCEEFQELTEEEVISIIECDDLDVDCESVVFEAVVRWTNYNKTERASRFAELLKKVRLTVVPLSYIWSDVLQNELVKKSAECKERVELSWLATNRCAQSRRYRPRLPREILLAIGGWSTNGPTNAIEAYDPKLDVWFPVTNQEKPRAFHGAVFLKGSVFCIGGFERQEYYNSVRRLDLAARTWHEMPSMYHRRCYVSVTVLRDKIYAMGGFNGQTSMNSAEVFDLEANQWSLIAPMNEQRSDANCATLNGKIYICGGFNGTIFHQTVELYNPETNQWTALAEMSCRRSGVAVIAHDGKIYAVGGFDGGTRLRTAEAYTPSTNTWQEVASMNCSRSNFGLEVVDGRLFAVGGYNSVSTSFRVEAYNPQLNTWREAGMMDTMRSALNCCVISGLPNMVDYTLHRDELPLWNVEAADNDDDAFD